MQHIDDEKRTNITHTRAVVDRDRQTAYKLLVRDYFVGNCLYNDEAFKRCFRLNRTLFLCISNILQARYEYFKQKPDTRGRMSFSDIQKCAAVLRYLVYGIAFDATYKYFKVSRMTANECVDHFCACVYEVFCKEYLCKLIALAIEILCLTHEERHGFLGMIGSLYKLDMQKLSNYVARSI